MSNKKILTGLLSVLLVFTLILTACGEKKLGAKEGLQKALDAAMEMESYSFNGTLKLDIDLPEEANNDPDAAMILSYLENLELQMNGVSHQDKLQTETTLDLKLGDMRFSVPMVFTEKKIWIKVPNIPIPGIALPPEITSKFIELDFEEINELAGEAAPVSPESIDVDKLKELGLEIFKIVTNHFDEEKYFTVYDPEDIDVPKGIDAKQVIKFNITNENLEPAVITLVDQVIPEILDVLAKPEWTDTLQIDPADIEEMKRELADSKGEVNEGLAELKETVNINDFSLISVLDKKNYVPYQELNVDVDITSEGQTGRFGANFIMTLSDINESPEFKIGIPSEDESIKLMELMKMFMGGL